MTINIAKAIYNQVKGVFTLFSKFELFKVNTQKNEGLGKPNRIVLHWTAGHKHQLFDEYHYNITEKDNRAFIFQTLKLSEKGSHLWGRNSGAIGITLCCKSKPTDLPTEKMIETTAVLVAELCCWQKLDIFGKIKLDKKGTIYRNKQYVQIALPGQSEFDIVSDHAAYARADGYFPDRWDIEKYLPVIKNKAEIYFKELKAGKRKFQFLDIIKG